LRSFMCVIFFAFGSLPEKLRVHLILNSLSLKVFRTKFCIQVRVKITIRTQAVRMKLNLYCVSVNWIVIKLISEVYYLPIRALDQANHNDFYTQWECYVIYLTIGNFINNNCWRNRDLSSVSLVCHWPDNSATESAYETLVFNCDQHRHSITTEIKYPYCLTLYPVHFLSYQSSTTYRIL